MSNNLIIKNTARGLNSNKILYLVSALLFGFLCIYFFKNSEILVETADAAAVTVPTVTDFWFYIFHGIVSNNSIDMYKIPIVWLFICVFVLIAVLNYPTKDLYSSGIQTLIRSNKRSLWWFSKCIWNIAAVTLLYAAGVAGACIAALFFGGFSFDVTNIVLAQAIGAGMSLTELNLTVFLMPLITLVALAMLQMTLSFVLKPIFSFIIVFLYMFLSTFFCSPVLIGNCAMLLNNFELTGMGFGALSGIAANTVVILISAAVGLIYFSNADILKRG